MQIVSYGGSHAFPDYFIAYTDDGTMIEYGNTSGNTSNSKQQLGTSSTTVLSWLINKITDANGNSMTFRYGSSTTGEIWIDEIQYLNSEATVKFGYTSLRDTLGRNTSYLKGFAIEQSKLLQTVTVNYNNTPVRKYQFKYVHEDKVGERSSHLKEVILYGEGGKEQLNATTIIWGDQNNTKQETPLTTAPDGYIITGDFNGDGYTDYVIFGQEKSETVWKLYTRVPGTENFVDAGFTGTHKSTTNELACFFYRIDIDGDDCDELILADMGDQDSSIYEIKIISLKNGGIDVIASKIIKHFSQIVFGDFEGDGKTDILIMKKDIHNNCTFESYMSSNNRFIEHRDFPNLLNIPCKIRSGDFNGDRRTDIELNYNNDKLYLCYYDNVNKSFNYTLLNATAEYNYTRYSGDFNGDGITDLLTYTYSLQSGLVWQLYFGKGDGTYTNVTTDLGLNTLTETSPEGWTMPKNKIMIVDLDGDGKDEIMQILTSTLKILYSKGCIDGTYIFSPKTQVTTASFSLPKHINIDDFNNDGTLDLIVQKDRRNRPTAIFLHRNKLYEAPKEIIDGFEKTLKLVFKPQYLMVKDGTATKKYFHHILDNLQISNGLGQNVNTMQYQFSEPVFSDLRKTFLGFKKFTCINNQENKKIISIFAVENSKQILNPVSQTTYYNNVSNDETTYIYAIKDLRHNRYIPYANETTIKNFLSDIRTETITTLNSEGRLQATFTKTFNGCNESNWLHFETKTCFYETIILSGNQKKTLPQSIYNKREYWLPSGYSVTDTLTYGYYTDITNKGRLAWERQGNLCGSITTSYRNYDPSGVCQLKTVSAQGCTPRSEVFTYDNTKRFITSITNSLNHEIKFTYDAKTGNKKTETDPNGLITKYDYDFFGNLTKVTFPDNTTTETSVQWVSNALLPNAKYSITTTSEGKPTVTMYYDILGREVFRLDDGFYYETQYNNLGQVTKTSYPLGSLRETRIWHEYTYDVYGRQLTETAPYTNLSYSYNIRKVTVTDNLRNTSISKNYDALGRIVQATDAGGTIIYHYMITGERHHQVKININNAITTIITDQWGNRLSITDPDAGTIISEYNNFNELVKQTDANDNITAYQYDVLGRVIQKKFTTPPPKVSTQTIDYVYDYMNTSLQLKGMLYHVKVNGVYVENLKYDNLGRITHCSKNIDNNSHLLRYHYNGLGQLSTLTYDNSLTVNYSYTSTGKLDEIKRSSDNSLIYKVNSRNKYNQTTSCEYGNGVMTEYDYNTYSLLTRINTGKKNTSFHHGGETKGIINPEPAYWVDSTILNYRYAYDEKGLMSSRSESVLSHKETYQYDNLDRLTETTVGSTIQTFSYANNGNINNKSNLGTYSYGTNMTPPKPHAVTEIDLVSNNLIYSFPCNVTYNSFNQPTQITEGDYNLKLFYGADQQRNKTMKYKNGALENTHYYINKYYECDIDSAQVKRYYYYIYGDNGVVALNIRSTTYVPDTIGGSNNDTLGNDRGMVITDSTYYIHTDHLGSYCALTNASKKVVQRNCFDPWGNVHYIYMKDTTEFEIDTCSAGDPPERGRIPINFTLTYRGFTGHEHYPYFKIINMNGRLYDPVISRFFSPDKYVANSSFTQDFNRYTYCRNNPLSYVDPSGENFFEVLGNILFAPVRFLTEGFTWINDKINGYTRPNGYCNPSYLAGKTEPGGYSKYNPVNAVPYYSPVYIPPTAGPTSISIGTGGAMGANNEWHDITDRPIIQDPKSKLGKRLLYSACTALGIAPAQPIPTEYRNSAFVSLLKNLWFKYAPNPSGGYNVDDGTIVGNNSGCVIPNFTTTNLFSGGSTMYLHEQNSFSSLERLFLTLGHELVHVSQFKALAGVDGRYYDLPIFRDMLDYHAHSFSNLFGGRYWNKDFDLDWAKIFPNHYNTTDFRNFAWFHLINYPF